MPFPAINPVLARALAEQGYEEPTSVQAAVLEPEATDRDLLARFDLVTRLVSSAMDAPSSDSF